MRILVTGSTGFIGRNVVEALGSSHEVLAPSHRELELLDEQAVREFLRQNRVEAVIHGAVTPGHRNAKDPRLQLFRNTRMFFSLARSSDLFRKMIFLSSGAAYDIRRSMVRIREEEFDSEVPLDEHGFSKYCCAKYSEKTDSIVELRLFGVFGKYEDYAIRFISNAICKVLFDLPLTLRRNRRFAYLYIKDLMPILDYFLVHEAGHRAYNVVPDDAVELLDLAGKIRELSGKDLPIRVNEPGLGPEYTGDNRRLRKEIPGVAFTPMEEALEELYGWYAEHRASIQRDCLLADK